jgi:hypothetical protein
MGIPIFLKWFQIKINTNNVNCLKFVTIVKNMTYL